MEEKATKTHWLKTMGDYRFEALEEMFNGFEKALENFNRKLKENDWYDGGSYDDETELIYGVILVTLQNYINGCCSDFIYINPEYFKKKYEYYSINSENLENGISKIRLINELANYFKHKDEKNNLHKNTKDCFEKLGLIKYIEDEDNYWENDIITEGLFMLCPDDSSIKNLLPIVKTWREKNIELI